MAMTASTSNPHQLATSGRRAPSTAPAGAPAAAVELPIPQYSRRRILATWAAAALPMAALAWIVAPLLAGTFEGPSAWPRAILLSLTAGMVWQFVFVVITVRREQGSLRWSVVKDALWLRAPRSPRTGRRGGRLWWLLVPLVLAVAAKEELPKIPAPVHRDQSLFLQSVAGQEFFSGNWPWFALIVTMMIFNTVLGEGSSSAACCCLGCEAPSGDGTGWSTVSCSVSTTCTCRGRSPPTPSTPSSSPSRPADTGVR